MRRKNGWAVALGIGALLLGSQLADASWPRHRGNRGGNRGGRSASAQLVRAHKANVREAVERVLQSGALSGEQQFWAQIGLENFLASPLRSQVTEIGTDWRADSGDLEASQQLRALYPQPASVILPGGGILCAPGDTLLLAPRFLVQVTFQDYSGNVRRALACRMTPYSGYFWFLDPYNVEIPMKTVANSCFSGQPTHWLFAAGLTTYGVQITIFDPFTGLNKTYTNTLGQTFNTILDQALPFPCP